jgi:peptidoglycan/xylan/chitin deacetylase (PgdA/CDA1 family)
VRLSLAVHVLAVVAVALAPARWAVVLAALVADHVVLLGASLCPRSQLLGPTRDRLPPAADGDAVAITFDDGPHPLVTPAILDLLDAHGARATFFCVGQRAAAHPEVVAEITRRGHRVGNHTWRHSAAFVFLPPGRLAREIDRTQEALASATGRRPVFVRAPAGLRSPWLDPLLVRRGLTLVAWTRRGFDTVTRDPARIAARLLRGLRPGDILLLHDGSSALDQDGHPVVLGALERVLAEVDARGLDCVVLPEGPEPG